MIFCVTRLCQTSWHVDDKNIIVTDWQTNEYMVHFGRKFNFYFYFFPIAALWKSWKWNAIQQIKKIVALHCLKPFKSIMGVLFINIEITWRVTEKMWISCRKCHCATTFCHSSSKLYMVLNFTEGLEVYFELGLFCELTRNLTGWNYSTFLIMIRPSAKCSV